MEIWKDIKGHEGHHQISSFGRVKSIERFVCNSLGNIQLCKGKIFNPNIDRYGYKKIALRINGKRKYYTIHRLVAMAFIPNPENKPQVNHIDEVKLNNNVSNLEWVTAQENTTHNDSHIKRGKKKRKKVIQKDLKGNVLKIHDSMTLTNKDGFDRSGVWASCTGKQKTHGGYIWEFI